MEINAEVSFDAQSLPQRLQTFIAGALKKYPEENDLFPTEPEARARFDAFLDEYSRSFYSLESTVLKDGRYTLAYLLGHEAPEFLLRFLPFLHEAGATELRGVIWTIDSEGYGACFVVCKDGKIRREKGLAT